MLSGRNSQRGDSRVAGPPERGRACFGVVALLLLGACSANLSAIHSPPHSLAVTTTGPWSSMIYLARTDAGVVVIDLGWVGGEGTLRRALREIDAEPADVTAVFLTHSHRDHIVGWRLLRDATFHMAEDEVDRFVGVEEHRGLVPRLANWLLPARRPAPGELKVRGFADDTAFVLGGDTLHAYVVAGHTAGSAVYLFRGVLFAGDAISWSPFGGLRPDQPRHSDDSDLSRANLAELWERLPGEEVEWVCTAHARCAAFDEELARGPP